MGRLEALRQVIIGQEKAMEKELNELQKMGIKTYLDNHNAWLERKELDAFSVIEDPLNDANFEKFMKNRLKK